ncbi:MAG: hypothetical protein EXS29_00145 [Pedosphaera sp.]|nr:hypothetical protein [Pedosphaera sp.]MSS99714.1 hypothetical protein [Pedosphaera sp.]
MSQWKVILATLFIFGSGVFAGSLLLNAPVPVKLREKHPEKPEAKRTMPWEGPARAESLKRLEKDLNLTAEQREKVGAILAEGHKRSRAIAEPLFAKMQEEGKKVREQIRAELTPEQVKKFDSSPMRSRGPFPSRGDTNASNFFKKFPKEKRPGPPGGTPPPDKSKPVSGPD